jgi:hypothetical protein
MEFLPRYLTQLKYCSLVLSGCSTGPSIPFGPVHNPHRRPLTVRDGYFQTPCDMETECRCCGFLKIKSVAFRRTIRTLSVLGSIRLSAINLRQLRYLMAHSQGAGLRRHGVLLMHVTGAHVEMWLVWQWRLVLDMWRRARCRGHRVR